MPTILPSIKPYIGSAMGSWTYFWEDLAARLSSIAPGSLDHVFVFGSGSVVGEIALKMTVQ